MGLACCRDGEVTMRTYCPGSHPCAATCRGEDWVDWLTQPVAVPPLVMALGEGPEARLSKLTKVMEKSGGRVMDTSPGMPTVTRLSMEVAAGWQQAVVRFVDECV